MAEPKLTIKKVFGHLLTIHKHRKWVRYYCRLAGIRWRGWKHDLSKYSPKEFWESARYWTGYSSPIPECKKVNGYSKAWLHHKGRNSHHYEYWQDNFDKGGEALLMPKNDFVEQVCDFLAAGRTYNSGFGYSTEYEWWQEKRTHCAMNPKNKKMLDIIFSDFRYADNHGLSDCPTALAASTPESLIKSGYIQAVWEDVLWKWKEN